jgi:hypothetical protein
MQVNPPQQSAVVAHDTPSVPQHRQNVVVTSFTHICAPGQVPPQVGNEAN